MPKTKIKITETNESVLLYGITSQLNDYKLSWILNNELKINLSKTDDYLMTKKGINDDLLFSKYQSVNDTHNITLISNKTEDSIKLINLPNIDYLLKIDSLNINTNEFITKLKVLKEIIAVTNLKDNPNIQKKIQKEITNFLK